MLQERERSSVAAVIKGRRWYAKRLLQTQMFPNNREASLWLISSSRRLITESRQRIQLTRNNTPFRRVARRAVN